MIDFSSGSIIGGSIGSGCTEGSSGVGVGSTGGSVSSGCGGIVGSGDGSCDGSGSGLTGVEGCCSDPAFSPGDG